MKPVHVVIVNYRTAGLAVDCLRSLAPEVAAAAGRCQATVVDGGSADRSADRLAAAIAAEGWGGWCDLLPLAENRGFAAGNNAAIRPLLTSPSPPDYILLLNPDTIVRPGAVRALADFLDTHPRVGIVGSRLEATDGTPHVSAFRFPTVAAEFEGGIRLGLVSRLLARAVVAPPVRDEPHPTDWVSGAAMMVRRAVFDAVGLLDDGYFLYFEETDFCLRARRAGWPCWYVPAGRVVHLVGQSSGVTDPRQPRRRVPSYWFASRRRYFRRNHGRVYEGLASAAWLAGFALWRARRRVQGKPDTDPVGLLGDFVRYNFLRRPAARVTP
ncbi:MAG: glycosyltransferase family 2 protein [Gemmataceae bacterium]|nr:glycosyltransferase family 2 protein [Gemmataceae bacterium]